MLSPHTTAPAAGSAGHSWAARRGFARLKNRVLAGRPLILLLGLGAAILLPELALSPRLPSVRPEQLLLPYGLLVLLVCRGWRSRARLGWLDWIFAGLAVSTAVSIVVPPLILHHRISPRDFYELLKLALYYSYFRLSLSAFAEGGTARRLLWTLLIAGGACAAIGVLQYFDLLRINAWLTPLFAPEHHLTVLRQSGRVVGTFANPNYLGIFCVIVLLAALLTYWIGSTNDRRIGLPTSLLLPVSACAALGLVMTGSRTALFALVVAVAALAAVAVSRRLPDARPLRLAGGVIALGVLLFAAVAVVELVPRGGVDYLGRVAGGLAVNEDASFGLRLARWRSVVDAWLPASGGGNVSTHTPLTAVHPTGVVDAPPDAIARDATRKADLLRIASALDAYHRATGVWPPPDRLAVALVPRYLPSLPADPGSGEPYLDVVNVSGYSLMAMLENPAEPNYPNYGIGSSPNYLLNGGFEQGSRSPNDWDPIPGSAFTRQSGGSLYGDHVVVFRGDPNHPDQRAGIFQQRYFGRPGGNPFTATVWIKIPQPEPGQLELYANVVYADGDRADPLTRIPADMTKVGVWQRVSLGIVPPANKTVAFMGIYLVSAGWQGEALIDGFQLVDGPVPLDFARTREAPPSDTLGFNPETQLRKSPIIGVGPEKGEQGSSLDDEYLLYAARYGVAGILLYLALYFGTLLLAMRAALRTTSVTHRLLGLLIAATVIAFLLFNITAGSFYELQLMAVFWLLTGAALSSTYGIASDG